MARVLNNRFEGTGRAAVALACAAALATATPARAGEPASPNPAEASDELNELAQKHAFKAVEHFNNGAYVDSEEEFQRVKFYAPNWRPLHFNLGVLAEAQGKLGTAVSEYKLFRPLGSPEEQMIVDQRIDELGRRKLKISGAYKRQIALSATAMTLGAAGLAGGVTLVTLMVRNSNKAEQLDGQASMLEAMDPTVNPNASAQAMELRSEADRLTEKKGAFLYGGLYLAIFGLLAVGYSFVPLTKAIKSKRELDGIALGRTRLKWSGGAGVTLRF